ncbi:hypothetical protein TRVL_02895 [Trypanosoma vivax]|nr:hypothetical protein TRVL_02895 [Trypanosoma vivax]
MSTGRLSGYIYVQSHHLTCIHALSSPGDGTSLALLSPPMMVHLHTVSTPFFPFNHCGKNSDTHFRLYYIGVAPLCMRRGPLTAGALPLLVASSACVSWADVLVTYRDVTALLDGVYRPTTEELNKGLLRMETSWGASLFYYGIVKGICRHKYPPTRLVSTALERFKRFGHFYAIKRIMEEDVDATTYQGARTALVYASFTGMWEHAIRIYQNNPIMHQNIADVSSLVGVLSTCGCWEGAFTLINQRSPRSLHPSLIRPVVRSLGVSGEYKRMLALVAASLAQGHGMNIKLFSALVKSLQLSGQWKSALETAVDLGLMSPMREAQEKSLAMYTGLVDCLYASDPYYEFSVQDVVGDITYRMHPRLTHERQLQRTARSFRLISPNEIFRRHRSCLSALSSVITKQLSLTDVHTRPVAELAEEAFKQCGVQLVLDTNFVLHCATKNQSLSHFYPPMRRQYPRLEGKSPFRVVIPFTTVRETYQLIWGTSAHVKRSVRSLLWSRVTALFRDPLVKVLSFSSEYPCTAFSVITSMAYSRLNEPANENDPDRRILNTCVALQYAFRQRYAASLQGVEQLSDGAMLFSFLKYHVRRHHRDVRGVACEQLLLCTMDKRLSLAADELGIQTFPRFDCGLHGAATEEE